MSASIRRRPARKGKLYTVVMKSRDNQKLRVRDPLDVQFLELADEFQLKAREIIGDPPDDRSDSHIAS